MKCSTHRYGKNKKVLFCTISQNFYWVGRSWVRIPLMPKPTVAWSQGRKIQHAIWLKGKIYFLFPSITVTPANAQSRPCVDLCICRTGQIYSKLVIQPFGSVWAAVQKQHWTALCVLEESQLPTSHSQLVFAIW